ncbi:MAG: hypothetical protein VXY83_00295 [Pseudomonadota bacterium]|nr:hypothetical protein [Pseudomonadota bacterium]
MNITYVNFTSPQQQKAAVDPAFDFYYKNWPQNQAAFEEKNVNDPFGGINRNRAYMQIQLSFVEGVLVVEKVSQ